MKFKSYKYTMNINWKSISSIVNTPKSRDVKKYLSKSLIFITVHKVYFEFLYLRNVFN